MNKPGRGEDDFEYALASLGLAYERQAHIGPFYADFLIKTYKLVVEIDGTDHRHKLAKDARRTGYLEGLGYRVVRLQDEYVMKFKRHAAIEVLRMGLETDEWDLYLRRCRLNQGDLVKFGLDIPSGPCNKEKNDGNE